MPSYNYVCKDDGGCCNFTVDRWVSDYPTCPNCGRDDATELVGEVEEK